MAMNDRRIGLVLGLCLVAGCGDQVKEMTKTETTTVADGSISMPPGGVAVRSFLAPADRAPGTPNPADSGAKMMAMMGGMSGDATKAADTAPPKIVPRKIVYTADIDLNVESFARAEQGIVRLIR